MSYIGSSIVDYLGSIGQDSSYSARAKLAKQYGISNYTGTGDQNTQLLNTIRSQNQPSSVKETINKNVQAISADKATAIANGTNVNNSYVATPIFSGQNSSYDTFAKNMRSVNGSLTDAKLQELYTGLYGNSGNTGSTNSSSGASSGAKDSSGISGNAKSSTVTKDANGVYRLYVDGVLANTTDNLGDIQNVVRLNKFPEPNYSQIGNDTATQTSTSTQNTSSGNSGNADGLTDAERNSLSGILKSSLDALRAVIEKQHADGYQIDPNLSIDKDTVNRFLELAKTKVHPYYAQQIKGIQEDVVRNAGMLSDQYKNEIGGAEQQFRTGLGTARENYAGAGLAFSGQRGLGEQNMESSTNRSLASLGASYRNNMIDLGRGAEKQIGAGNVNYSLPSLQGYNASVSGLGGFSGAGSLGGYTPGTYGIGEIPRAEDIAAQQKGQEYVDTANKDLINHRSYADLFNN